MIMITFRLKQSHKKLISLGFCSKVQTVHKFRTWTEKSEVKQNSFATFCCCQKSKVEILCNLDLMLLDSQPRSLKSATTATMVVGPKEFGGTKGMLLYLLVPPKSLICPSNCVYGRPKLIVSSSNSIFGPR